MSTASDAARALFLALDAEDADERESAGGATFLLARLPDEVEDVSAKLNALAAALLRAYNHFRGAGDLVRAGQINVLLAKTVALQVEVQRDLIAKLDSSPDVAEARAALAGVCEQLDAAAEDAKAEAARYADVAAALNALARVLSWL